MRAPARALHWVPVVVFHEPVTLQAAAAAAFRTVAAAALLDLGQPAAVGSIAGTAAAGGTPLGAGADSAEQHRWVCAVPASAEMPAGPAAENKRDEPSSAENMRAERVNAEALLDLGQQAAKGSISTSAGAEGTPLGAGADSAEQPR